MKENAYKAFLLRYLPGPFGRYRRRYRFYQQVKNSELILQGKIRHSGILLPLNLGDWVQYWMFMEGTYEKQLVDYLLPHVKNKVFFDVGANVGSYTMSLSKSAEKIYSFEASPTNAATLRNFIEISKLHNIELINKAVSDKSGENIVIYTSPDTGGNNTRFHNFGKGGEVIETITLDQFVRVCAIDRIDVIKMDIEGSEFAAFIGAREILDRFHPMLLVEFHAVVARQSGWELADLYELLLHHGYKAYELDKRKLVPFDGSRLSTADFYANLIFT
jgi:FkbM family methyltransferase